VGYFQETLTELESYAISSGFAGGYFQETLTEFESYFISSGFFVDY